MKTFSELAAALEATAEMTPEQLQTAAERALESPGTVVVGDEFRAARGEGPRE
jgi:hypothetical protein